jgi:hypothetical protein
MRLFAGVTERTDHRPGFELVVLDEDGDELDRAAGEPADLDGALRSLPGRPVVVAVAPGLDSEGLAARMGWTHAATNRGHPDWPACLAVDPRGHDAAYAARLAWLWHHRPTELTVLGDRTETYRVVATADLAAELVVEVDQERREEVAALIAALPGVRAVR